MLAVGGYQKENKKIHNDNNETNSLSHNTIASIFKSKSTNKLPSLSDDEAYTIKNYIHFYNRQGILMYKIEVSTIVLKFYI